MLFQNVFRLLVLALICFAVAAEARRRRKKPPKDDFAEDVDRNSDDSDSASSSWDYLVFSQRWAPSVCHARPADGCSIPITVRDWTIHGLWASNYDGSHVQFCDERDDFDESKLKPFRARLEQSWPSILQGPGKNSHNFWAHEWEKHGTCSKSLPTLRDQQKYFAQSLKFFEDFRVNDALTAKGIVPSNAQSYSKAQIQRALRDGVGKGRAQIKLVCTYARLPGTRAKSYAAALNGEEKVAQFVEARICVDKQFGVINCPGAEHEGNCPKTGIFLPNFSKKLYCGVGFCGTV